MQKSFYLRVIPTAGRITITSEVSPVRQNEVFVVVNYKSVDGSNEFIRDRIVFMPYREYIKKLIEACTVVSFSTHDDEARVLRPAHSHAYHQTNKSGLPQTIAHECIVSSSGDQEMVTFTMTNGDGAVYHAERDVWIYGAKCSSPEIEVFQRLCFPNILVPRTETTITIDDEHLEKMGLGAKHR